MKNENNPLKEKTKKRKNKNSRESSRTDESSIDVYTYFCCWYCSILLIAVCNKSVRRSNRKWG